MDLPKQWREPVLQGVGSACTNVFTARLPRTSYDQLDLRGQLQLVKDTVEASIQSEYASLLLNIQRECEHFHTMAIYVTVLTDPGSMFHAAKAVIEGVKPADFSYEFFGEIK